MSTSKTHPSYICRKKFDRVYQFHIVMDWIEPVIWRRIQVPDRYSFWDLHCAITDAFGWLDYHLHQFVFQFPGMDQPMVIGIPMDDDWGEVETLPDREIGIADVFNTKDTVGSYEYDFGDGWRHTIAFEEILPREEGVNYPRCIAGERACPPEDVGGPPGYEQFCKAVSYKNSPDHEDMLEWCGGWFDPNWFDLDLVRFGNPSTRWRVAFENADVPRTMRTEQYHRLRRRSRLD